MKVIVHTEKPQIPVQYSDINLFVLLFVINIILQMTPIVIISYTAGLYHTKLFFILLIPFLFIQFRVKYENDTFVLKILRGI